MDLELQGRIVLITGGSVGIGLGVAEAFLSEKAKVVICARDTARIDSVVADLKAKYKTQDVWGLKPSSLL